MEREREREGGPLPEQEGGEGANSNKLSPGTAHGISGEGTPQPREEGEGGRKEMIQTGNTCNQQTNGRTEGTGKRRRCTAPSRGEGDARGLGTKDSI